MNQFFEYSQNKDPRKILSLNCNKQNLLKNINEMQRRLSDKKHLEYQRSYQNLFVRLYTGPAQPQIVPYQISSDSYHDRATGILKIDLNIILKMVSSMKNKIKVNKFLNILVQDDDKLVNIFKLKKTSINSNFNTTVKLKRQSQNFYLNVWILDIDKMQKTNPLLQYTVQEQKYIKILKNLQEINESISKELKNLNQDQKSSYDIAYMISQPLVQPQQKQMKRFKSQEILYEYLKHDNPMSASIQVSFQKQYEKFLSIFKAGSFFSNIKIGTFVATQNNIRQVLSEKCNILHFSCHGQIKYLEIQKDKDVGYLDALTFERLKKLLQNKNFLKIIIFNACFSNEIAKAVNNQYPHITTIGYIGKADDKYCQIFTQRIYNGIYKQKEHFFRLFEKTQSYIISQNPQEGQKLVMFRGKIEPKYENLKTQFATNQQYKIDPGTSINLGNREPIGIKKQLYFFIKDYLLNRQRIKFFVIGELGSGKTLFVKKALFYTLNRSIFQDYQEIDCNKDQNKPIISMLQLKLAYKIKLEEFIKKNKQKNIIIVVDHCNQLIQNDPRQFMDFFRKLQNSIKFGKIVLITDKISYLTQINIMMDQNVYEQKEISPQKIPSLQYSVYMRRWYPQKIDRDQLFKKTRAKFWFQALRKSQNQDDFQIILNELNEKESYIQKHGVVSNLQKDFQNFRIKIKSVQQKLNIFVREGYYSRNQDLFILINIFPDFSKIKRNEAQSKEYDKDQPSRLLNEINQCYEDDIKGLIQIVIEVLGRFHTQNYDRKWWQNQLLEITQKLFYIIGLASLIKDRFVAEKQMEHQLFNSYALIIKLFNRYQKKLSDLPRVLAQCEAIKLKIYMTLYNLYKHQYYSAYIEAGVPIKKKRKTILMRHQNNLFQNFQNIQASSYNQDQSAGNQNDFLSNQEFSYRQNFAQRDSINHRSSIRSNKGNSEIRDSTNPKNRQNSKKELAQKETRLKDFQTQLKNQYKKTNYWDLIEKVKQFDTMIRNIQSEEAKKLAADTDLTIAVSPMQQFSWSESHKNFEACYAQIEKYYNYHQSITRIYDGLINYKQFDEENPAQSIRIQRVFFTQSQLQLTYLLGLKIVIKLFTFIEGQLVFDFQSRYRDKLDQIRIILQKAENILQYSLAKKSKKGADLSFKKFYKQYLQIYIDLRFRFQKFCLPYATNGQKQKISIFNKLLNLSYDTRSFELKNNLQRFIQQTFYNTCSILISQPVGFVPKNLKKSATLFKPSKNQKHSKKQKDKKFYIKDQNQEDTENFLRLNVYRSSDQMVQLMKNQVQRKIVGQIHIQTQVLNYEKIFPRTRQPQFEQERKKKRLIYLMICDCKQGQNHDSIFLENSYGESVKKEKRQLLRYQHMAFPYAPVIILYGSNPQILQSYYRQLCQAKKQSIFIISFGTSNEVPDIELDSKPLLQYIWNDYVEKKLGMTFLANFWIKFCQVYFNQEHQSHRNQVIRSFNIAKIQSTILLKKKYLQGIKQSQIQQQIDKISQKITLDPFEAEDGDLPVILQKNINIKKENERKNNNDIPYLNFRDSDTMRNSSMNENSYVKKQQQIMQIYDHQIGSNYEVFEFLKRFWQNIKNFETRDQFHKIFIEYCPNLNQTSINIFVKTVYNKLLRLSNKFELGVELINMKNENVQLNYSPELFLYNLQNNQKEKSEFNFLADLGFNRGILEESQMQSSSDQKSSDSSFSNFKKRKKVEIYFGVAQKDLKILIEGFTAKDKANILNKLQSDLQNQNQYEDIIFRIVIVDANQIDPEVKQSLQTYHSCKINRYKERVSYIENLYHVCDTILSCSRRIQNFNFFTTFNMIFPKNKDQQNLKKMTSRQIKEKIILEINRTRHS